MTERYDGDDRKSRTAFRAYDENEPVFRRSAWQIWRDACAWQASRATPADQEPIGWEYYEEGKLFKTYDSADKADHAKKMFGGVVRPVFAPADQEISIPEGWQLVPFDPTSAMTFVGQKHRYESAFSIGAIWQEMLDAAPQPPQPEAQSVRDAWISVDERLPEQHEWVLVSDGTWSAIGTHRDDEDLEPNKRWMDESAELIESNGIKITHWQPLPQPPKG